MGKLKEKPCKGCPCNTCGDENCKKKSCSFCNKNGRGQYFPATDCYPRPGCGSKKDK